MESSSKTKNFALFIGILGFLVLALGFASAALTVSITPSNATQTIYPGNSTSFVLTISNTYTDTNISSINFSSLVLTSGSNTITLTSNQTNFTLENGTSKAILLSASTSSSQAIGTYSKAVTITGVNESNTSQQITATSTITPKIIVKAVPEDFCGSSDNNGELAVTIDDISVDEGFGDDEDFWYPFDQISIDINVENNGDWDVKDIEMGFCLMDTDSGDCILDEDDVDFTKDKFDLKNGKDEDTTITFTLPSDVLDEDYSNFAIYVSAEGEVDDSDSDYDGDSSCAADNQDIEIRTGEEFVILEGFEDLVASCGSTLSVSANAWNIDSDDLEEVTIDVYNKELGIDQTIDVGDIDSFDSTEFSALIKIPSNATAKTYNLEFTVYDEDNDIFENEEDDESVFNIPLKIEGNCGGGQGVKPTITVNLESEANVGEELAIKVSVLNNGNAADFVLSPSGYDSWATLVSVDPATQNIASSSTKDFIIKLKPTKEGTQTFNLKVLSNGQVVEEKVIQVPIESSQSFFSKLKDQLSGLGGNALYLIAAVFIVLIIVVIVLIIKVASSGKED